MPRHGSLSDGCTPDRCRIRRNGADVVYLFICMRGLNLFPIGILPRTVMEKSADRISGSCPRIKLALGFLCWKIYLGDQSCLK